MVQTLIVRSEYQGLKSFSNGGLAISFGNFDTVPVSCLFFFNFTAINIFSHHIGIIWINESIDVITNNFNFECLLIINAVPDIRNLVDFSPLFKQSIMARSPYHINWSAFP